LRSKGTAPSTFEVVPGRSAVLIKARSNVGPISFATGEVRGQIHVDVDGQAVDTMAPVKAQLTVSLRSLTSGNTLYDTELKRRIDARRHPDAFVELEHARHLTGTNRYELSGRIEIHDVTRALEGTVTLESFAKGVMIVRGQQNLDIREFNLEVPTTLALKIYPEVSVEMHVEARTQ
jgi:polyisoprenoid-binding protein YceI